MKSQALYQLGLRDALAALRAKHFSAEEYCAQLQRRIAERDSDIGVWAHYDPRQGQGAARRSAVHASNAASRLPLGGMPIAIKDIIDTADMPTEVGSPIYQGRVPERDAVVVERIVDVMSLIALMSVVIFVHPFPDWVVQSGAVMLAGAAGLLAALVAFKRGETKTARLLERLLRPLPQACHRSNPAGSIWSLRCFRPPSGSAMPAYITPACRPFI